MSNTAERDLDLVVWGATGFTGQLACAYLRGDASKFYSYKLDAPAAPSDLRWAVAGRSREKLEALSTGQEIIVCEADDEEGIVSFVKRARVVVGFAGPFVKYSDRVVSACARHGTHWCDITGEVGWHRSLIDRFGDRARATGACIVNHCGFDSIPSDLGTFFAVNALRSKQGASNAVQNVTNYQMMVGGMSGGTLQTGLAQQTHPIVLSAGVDVDDPFLLGGTPGCGARSGDALVTQSTQDQEIGTWVGPFMMAEINTRVVRRSNMLLGYGPELKYREVAVYPSEKQANKAASQAQNPAPSHVVQRLIEEGKLPKAGEGPLPALRAKSKFQALVVAQGDGGAKVACTVSGGDCGYEETAKMAVEAGLALVYDIAACPGAVAGGGFLTPAACFGSTLVNRLHKAGIQFRVLHDARRSDSGVYSKEAVAKFVTMVAKL